MPLDQFQFPGRWAPIGYLTVPPPQHTARTPKTEKKSRPVGEGLFSAMSNQGNGQVYWETKEAATMVQEWGGHEQLSTRSGPCQPNWSAADSVAVEPSGQIGHEEAPSDKWYTDAESNLSSWKSTKKCEEKPQRAPALRSRCSSLKKRHSVLHSIFPDQSSGRPIGSSIASSGPYAVSIQRWEIGSENQAHLLSCGVRRKKKRKEKAS